MPPASQSNESGSAMDKLNRRGSSRSLRSTVSKALSVGACTALLMTGALIVTAGPAAAISSPTVTSETPVSLPQGATSQTVTITGTGFVSGAVATFSGTGITVGSSAYVNSTTETAVVSIAGSAPVASSNITVTNTDTGAGVGTGIFAVTAAPTVTSVAPASLAQNQS
jgi:hypothetical protein